MYCYIYDYFQYTKCSLGALVKQVRHILGIIEIYYTFEQFCSQLSRALPISACFAQQHANMALKPYMTACAHVTSAKYIYRADSSFAPSQWEAAILCNDVFSHWLSTRLESALHIFEGCQTNNITITILRFSVNATNDCVMKKYHIRLCITDYGILDLHVKAI